MSEERFGRALSEIYAGIEWERSRGSRTMGMMLPALLAAHHARTVIEIGICDGFTTQVLSRALTFLWGEQGVLLSCDNRPAACDGVAGLAREATCLVEVICADSRAIDWGVHLAEFGRDHADLVLIDGCHEYEAVRADIDRTRRVLRTRGLMMCHDYLPEWPGVMRAIDEFQAQAHWRQLDCYYEPETGSSGFTILQRMI